MGVLSFATYCLPQPKSTPGACLHWLVSGQRSLKPSLTSKSVSDYNTKKEKSGKPWELAIHGACKVHPHTAACAALPLHTNPRSSPPHWHCCTHSSNTLPTNYAYVHAETLLLAQWSLHIQYYVYLFKVCRKIIVLNHQIHKHTHTHAHTHACIHTFHTHTHTHTHMHACTHTHTHTHSIYTLYTPSSAQQIFDEIERFLCNYVNYTVIDFINFLHFTVLQ